MRRARRAEPARRRPRVLRGRRRLRPLRALAGVGAGRTLGVPHLVHAVPAGALPGRAAGAVRVPVDDLRAHRPRGLERLAVRRRHGAGRGRAHVARRRTGPGPRLAGVDPRARRDPADLRQGSGVRARGLRLEGGRGGAPDVERRRRHRRAAPERLRRARAACASSSPRPATGEPARSRSSTRCRSASSPRPASSAPTSPSPRGSRSATT